MRFYNDKKFLKLIDKVSFLKLTLFFVLTIFISAVIYWLLSPSENGVIIVEKPTTFSFFEGLYFSVVTISSLGYGDMHPLGFSRYIAIFEVIVGLGLMGIMVAKLTSWRLSHHVNRLYIHETQKKLESFRNQINKNKHELNEYLEQLTYTITPNPSTRDLYASIPLHEKKLGISNELVRFINLVTEYNEFMTEEVKSPEDIFTQSLVGKVNICLADIREYINNLLNKFDIVEETLRNKVLSGNVGRAILNIVEVIKSTSKIISQSNSNSDIRISISLLDESVGKIENTLGLVTIVASDLISPDQDELADPSEQ